jgi:hypothetical protein
MANPEASMAYARLTDPEKHRFLSTPLSNGALRGTCVLDKTSAI